MNKILSYSGSKNDYINKINPIIEKSNKKHYYEPFIGSGSIFLNLNKEFESYTINDIDNNLICIWNSLANIPYLEIQKLYNQSLEKFGDIGKSKNSYYNFRNWFNENHWKKNTLDEGIYLMMLYNSCINSFARFGPNGFNQSYGNRNYTKDYTEETHIKVQEKLSKTKILNINFFEIEFKENSFLFLDPPYIERPSSYQSLSNSEFDKFINILKNSNNDICYTDLDHQFLNWNKIILRDKMKTTSPLKEKNSNTGYQEVMFYNFSVDFNELF